MKAIITLGYYNIAVTGLDAKALEALTKAVVVDRNYNDDCYNIEEGKRVEVRLVDDKQVQPKPVKQESVV
jgi:hypothetical protein